MQLVLIGSILTLFLAVQSSEAFEFVLPEAKEPSGNELLKTVGANPKDPSALMGALWRLIRFYPDASDADLQDISKGEREWLQSEVYTRGAVVWKEGEHHPQINGKLIEKIIKELEDKRAHDPRRQVDALLRQIGRIGTVNELPLLLLAVKQSRTHSGAWRFYATIQGILELEDEEKIVQMMVEKKLFGDVSLIAPLLRDLPSEKAGLLAIKFWSRYAVRNEKDSWGGRPLPLQTRLWLAWSISEVGPRKALEIFVEGLKCNDPGLRLFSGMGILRISDKDTAPFLFTALPEKTEAERNKWLQELQIHKPVPYRFPDPMALPFIYRQRGSRVDLKWLKTDGSVAKEKTDVWPNVQEVLPDGTFYSRTSTSHSELALTDPHGEVLVRFPGTRDLGAFQPSGTGGFWNYAPGSSSMVSAPANEKVGEFAPWGEMLRALPQGGELVEIGRGQMLLYSNGIVKIANRRGDVLWSIQGLDASQVSMIDEEKVLAVGQNEIKIYHRTKGLLWKTGGFTSLSWVRYHPEKAWVIFDGGSEKIFLYDPRNGKKVAVRIGGTDDDPYYWSKWVPKGQQWAE